MKEDLYELLGVQKTANASEIKKAYRKMSKKFHPDLGGDEEMFKKISNANEVLSDPEKRKKYDAYGHGWENAGGGFGGGFGGTFEEQLRRHHARANRGSDIHIAIELTLEECYNGCEKEVRYSYQKICNGCGGNGAKNGTSIHTCSACGGAGEVVVNRQMGFHTMQFVSTCNSCRGTGAVIDESCTICNGSKVTAENEVAYVKFPRGVENSQSIHSPGKGNASFYPGGDNGDAVFIIEEIPHKTFKRVGMDLFYKHDISYEDLVLGTKIDIKTIQGKTTKISVAPYTQNGKVFRLKKHGMSRLQIGENITPENCNDSDFGNYIIELNLVTPTEYSEEELKLIEQLRELKNKN